MKFQLYWTAHENLKIIGFSVLRIIAVPLALYGYLFYLANLGSINYFSLQENTYDTLFAKVAVTAVYLPDLLFFISGYLFARKGFDLLHAHHQPTKPLLMHLGKKMLRLYPLYLGIVLIYWQVSPTLHGGPVWYHYMDDAERCGWTWWRALLLIDNWWEEGCYDFAWYVPAEAQLALLTLGILMLFQRNTRFGLIAVSALSVIGWILTLTISSPLPSSPSTTTSSHTVSYFKSTYSHMPYYLLGVLFAYLAYNPHIKGAVAIFLKRVILRIILAVVAIGLIILIVLMPSVWEGSLGLEFGLARTGMFLAFLFLTAPSIFDPQPNKTILHRVAGLALGSLLMGGIVVGCSFWTREAFPYLDNAFLNKYTLSNMFLTVGVGGVLAAIAWPKPKKDEVVVL